MCRFIDSYRGPTIHSTPTTSPPDWFHTGVVLVVYWVYTGDIMKHITIDPMLHEMLKKKAKQDGRTLQWHINRAISTYAVYSLSNRIKLTPQNHFYEMILKRQKG